MESPATNIYLDLTPETIPTALVIGSGLTASLTCVELRALGFKVCLARLSAPVSQDVYCSTPEIDLDVFSGSVELTMKDVESFTLESWATIARDQKGFSVGIGPLKQRRFDTVFFAGDPGVSFNQSGLGNLCKLYSPLETDGSNPQNLVFLFDYPFPTDPAIGMSAFISAIKNSNAGGKSSVVFKNAPVRHLMGETLYDLAKTSGVMFYRYCENSIDLRAEASPDCGSDKVVVGFQDVIETGEKIEVACDNLFIVSGPAPEGVPDGMRKFMGADIDKNGFLVSDSIHGNSFKSFNSGVYCVGGFTGTLDLLDVISQTKSAAVTARAYALSARSGAKASLMNISDECVRCLTCHRICPHAAIWPISAPSKSTLQSIADACMECGICVSECPRKALEMKHFPEEAFNGFLDDISAQTNKIVVYGCSRSAGRSVADLDLPPDVIFFSVPCAGRVSESVILDTVAAGARGILIIGCHHGNCESNNGTDWACDRVKSVVSNFITPMNLKAAIEYNTIAPNEVRRFERIVSQFANRLK